MIRALTSGLSPTNGDRSGHGALRLEGASNITRRSQEIARSLAVLRSTTACAFSGAK